MQYRECAVSSDEVVRLNGNGGTLGRSSGRGSGVIPHQDCLPPCALECDVRLLLWDQDLLSVTFTNKHHHHTRMSHTWTYIVAKWTTRGTIDRIVQHPKTPSNQLCHNSHPLHVLRHPAILTFPHNPPTTFSAIRRIQINILNSVIINYAKFFNCVMLSRVCLNWTMKLVDHMVLSLDLYTPALMTITTRCLLPFGTELIAFCTFLYLPFPDWSTTMVRTDFANVSNSLLWVVSSAWGLFSTSLYHFWASGSWIAHTGTAIRNAAANTKIKWNTPKPRPMFADSTIPIVQIVNEDHTTMIFV